MKLDFIKLPDLEDPEYGWFVFKIEDKVVLDYSKSTFVTSQYLEYWERNLYRLPDLLKNDVVYLWQWDTVGYYYRFEIIGGFLVVHDCNVEKNKNRKELMLGKLKEINRKEIVSIKVSEIG